MTNPSISPSGSPEGGPGHLVRRRSPLLYIAGGCAAISLCLVLALAVNAVYWTARLRSGNLGEGGAAEAAPAQPEQIQPAVEKLPEGNASRGEALFESEECQACHALEAGVRKVGPSLAGVSTRAASARPGYSAEMYLYESIVSPQAYVAEGYPGGVMPGNYARRLTDQQLADLIAFLSGK